MTSHNLEMETKGPIIQQTRDVKNSREENGVSFKTAFILLGGITIIAIPFAMLILPTFIPISRASEITVPVALYIIQNSILLVLVVWDWSEMWILAWKSRKMNVVYNRRLKLKWLNAIMILVIHTMILAVIVLYYKKLEGVEADNLSNLTDFTIGGVVFHIILFNVSVKCKMYKLYRNYIDLESSSNVRPT